MVDEPTVYSATTQLSQKGKEKLFKALEKYIDAKIEWSRTYSLNPLIGYYSTEQVEERMQKAKENLQNLLNYLKIEVE